MYDALLVLQASVTKTASFNSTGLAVPGTPLAGLVARILYSAANQASGAGVWTFTVEHSDDNSTWYALASGAADAITLTTTAQAGEIFIPFRTAKAYVRLVLTLSGSSTTPTITYSADLGLSKP
jgi:hypothetical protein